MVSHSSFLPMQVKGAQNVKLARGLRHLSVRHSAQPKHTDVTRFVSESSEHECNLLWNLFIQ